MQANHLAMFGGKPIEAAALRFANAKHRNDLDSEGIYRMAALYAEFGETTMGWLEKLCNSYHQQACDALNVSLPKPFFIGKEEA
jgi:hypothetical protein